MTNNNWIEDFDRKWDNYEFSINSSDHYDGSNEDKIKDFISNLLTKKDQEHKAELVKLNKAEYWLSHVYLNWGRNQDLDVKEDFAKGFNIIAELTGNNTVEATEKGWKTHPRQSH